MSALLGDLGIIGYMTFGVLVSFILDPLISYVRTSLEKRGKKGIASWFSKYKEDFKLGSAIVGVSILISFVVVWGFGVSLQTRLKVSNSVSSGRQYSTKSRVR